MMSISSVVFVFWNFYFIFTSALYGPHPRIVSDNGHLILYAANDKNLTLKTTKNGYINVNDENLVLLVKDARNAAESVKQITKKVIDPFTSSINHISNLIEGQNGLNQRIAYLENNFTLAGSPLRNLPRYRNIPALARRINNLEIKMRRLMQLLNKNECASNPCKNGAPCQDIFDGYICQCPDAWEGPLCDKDVNECLRFSGTDLGCQNGATCINKPGSYECQCAPGWYGIHCTRRNQDCTNGSPQELCGHGTCVPQNTKDGYKCICDLGWTTDGKHPSCTVDVNECESSKPHCSVNPPVPCINVPGSFYCGSCPFGYSGNGYYCNDIDECLTYNGGCSMNPKVQCINTPGSRICGSCPPGYIGDGTTCSYRGVCQINNGGCHYLARCVENANIGDSYVQCICPSGYAGSGMGPNGCVRSEIGPYLNPCVRNPCAHGTCSVLTNSSFHCTCHAGFTGSTCNSPLSYCESNPCQNDGICSTSQSGYKCECKTGWTGQNCDKETEVCGGKLTGTAGFLEYPQNKTKYSHSLSCSWVISTGDPNKVINITFTKFGLEKSGKGCLYDWLQIHDGPNSGTHLIGRFCGKQFPKGGQFTSTHSSLYLWFRSDDRDSDLGFALKWNAIDPVCGGLINVESHGTIKSPGFPANYPPDRDCSWIFFAHLGKRIQFHFFQLLIGNNPNCDGDYLEIRSGPNPGDSTLAKFCNSSNPEPLTTTGSIAVVNFHSESTSRTDEGFQISYSVVEGIPGCGGLYTQEVGEIFSPTHNDQYPPNVNCEYKIKLSESMRIKIIFISFSLEESVDCSFDYVIIREGSRPDSPLVGRYCGNNLPPSYTSLGNELYIQFKTDWSANDNGFRLRYETVCGGIFTDQTGIIESPSYPNFVIQSINCIYEIKQALGYAIKISFTEFEGNYTNSQNRLHGFLEIRDGDNANSSLIGIYGGNTYPDEILSTHNYLWLKLQTDGMLPMRGFRANYSVIDIQCGGIVKQNLGIIKTPQHPNAYPPNKKCLWVVSAPPGYIIQLTWISFELEFSNKCHLDYVAVYDNNTNDGMGGLIGKYCGRKMPPTITSSSNLITIQFLSDMSLTYDGFILNYNFLDESKTCGGRYYVSAGVIRSPNFPNRYPPNKDCTWIITVPAGQQIMLNVTFFDLEMYIQCRSDFLEIRNGAQDSSPLIGKYCGRTIPSLIPSHTNNIYIRFRSDGTHNKGGFKITWDGSSRGCGGILNSPTGQITSPNYPQPYAQNAVCFWKIATSAGSVLQLIFMDIELENHLMCRSDYVEIFDGLETTAKSLGRYCMDTHPVAITASANRLMVKFRSDVSYEGRGFQLKYTTVCKNKVKGFRGVIESPNFPNSYPKNQDCSWTIVAPLGNRINITFSHFDIEKNSLYQVFCKFDYIEIKEGSEEDISEVLLNKYCGSKIPELISSTSNVVNVHFVTDSMVHGSGFRLEWVVDGCGGFLTHPAGRISTPGYPIGYPSNTVCEWTIQVDFDNSIELSMGAFAFEKTTNCGYDSLRVFNGPDENSPMISEICSTSNDSNLIVTSTGSIMFVKFTSDSSYNGRGFEATYKTAPLKCGGKYMAPTGSIHSRNYPQNYKFRDDCEWLIEVGKNFVVELNFHDFDIVDSRDNCTKNFLKIYDGENSEAPLLHTFCGSNKPNSSTTIRSTRNTFFVRMQANYYLQAKGFLANYTTGCGTRVVTDSYGYIDIADWGSWECAWTIIADQPSKHVSLTITHLDVLPNCESPALSIYDGEDKESPVIGHYCGNKAPATIVSQGSALHILLNYAYGAYISARYSVLSSECGGTMTSLSGYFASIGYPSNYPMNTECEWTINVSPGNKMMLSFLSFDLITSENCNADYVELREQNAAGKLIGIFCGSDIPSNISQSNGLWIQFKSSDIGTAKGFLAEYMLVHGNELTGNKGQIASPLYPMVNGQSADDVTWRITVDYSNVIQITFKDFYVDWFSAEDCYMLALDIYDGYDETSPLLGSYCNYRIPDPITSSSNVVFIKYYTVSYRYTIKFLLEWTQVQKKNLAKDLLNNLSVDGCGSENIIDISLMKYYNLSSPGFPTGYAGNLNCEWIFSTSPEQHLSIKFLAMDLEGYGPNCVLDAVKIFSRDASKPDWRHIDTVCLSNATSLLRIHTANMMKVIFKTDQRINKTGFAAIIHTECGGSLSGPNGIIDMTNYTDNLRMQINCEWNITVKTGRTIEIMFLNIDIKNSDENVCNNNYVLLRNGRYPDSPLLGTGKYCGTIIPNIESTSGNSLNIKYQASSQVKGFKLSYRELSLSCGRHVNLNHNMKSVNISSPNYPNIPPPHSECIWVISAPPGETIQLDFVERFDITYSGNCTKSGVELRDGGTMVSHLINIFCGEENIPGTQKTTDNLLYVRFYTDVSDPKNGFKAIVSIATCGGVIRGKTGKLSFYSPQFITYPSNLVCNWQIVGLVDHYLTLSFNEFRLPYMFNCRGTSHLKITEKLLTGNETTLAILCGMKKPNDIQTSSNEVNVQLNIGPNPRPLQGFIMTYNISQETCGGTIEAESGYISSPGYPVSKHYNRNCEWIIKVPAGRRITINILDFDFDYSIYYYDQGLAFFNGKKYGSYITYMHGNDPTRLVKSSDNVMIVYFWSSGLSNHRGFRLSFTSDEPSICIGNLNNESGVIYPPNANVTTYDCQWERKVKENDNLLGNQTLALTIYAPYIGRKIVQNCKHSTSSIKVTSESETTLIAQLCGTYDTPQIVRVPYPVTKLSVTQGRFHGKLNFTIMYKVQPCGGILTSSSGIITSPNYPNRNPETVDCAWLIKLDEGQSIKVNITSIDLDPSCSKDYLDIHNGLTPVSPKIGRYCGNNRNSFAFIQSESNALWIDFHASFGGTGNGFRLAYEPVTLGCGGIFHDRNRVIESPNYPNSYSNNVECMWEVRSEEGYHIGLQFIDRFQIETSTNCTNDFIEVWDYKEDEWISLGRICGRELPNSFNSTSSRMRILFRTNSKLTANGFRAKWHFNCGGSFTATETPKYIISPGYPIGYTQDLNCKYVINAPKKYVNIIFEDFNLENGKGYNDCVYDNVTIARTGFHPFHQFRQIHLFTYCGSQKPPPIRRQDGLTVSFRTDKWVNRKGFRFKYFIDSCGGVLNNEGEIGSPKDPVGLQNYYSSINCQWNITAPKNKIVLVRFTFFELEHHRNCIYDNVALYDGNQTSTDSRLAILCGNITNNLPVIRSTSNSMVVTMKTDSSNHFKGFKAIVLFMYGEQAGCGGLVNLTKDLPMKNIQSPDIDNSGQYVSNLDCQWLILAPIGEIIELTFDSFHLAPCENTTDNNKCTCDYLQIRDGGGPLSELVSQSCGHNKQQKVISSVNQFWIRMVTDGVKSSTGFRAKVIKIPSPCGPTILQVTDQQQYLKSPNYPDNYPNNIRCSWILRSNRTFSKFELHFDHLELQDPNADDQCNTDVVEIKDKINSHSISDGLGENFVFAGPRAINAHSGVRIPITSLTYCGTGQPPDYYSIRNELIISFSSDGSITKKGFQIDYRFAGCNRNYTGVQGRILNEGLTKDCIIRISAPANHTISLYFQTFLFSDFQICQNSGMAIHEGNSSSANQLANLCGYQIPNPVFSYGNELWIKAKTYRKRTAFYDIIFTTTNQGRGCGGTLYNFMGRFASPMYPENFRNNSVCRWDISVPRGLLVSLKFLVFDLGSINTCTTDYVELLDVNPENKDSTVRTRYCSGDDPAVYVGTSNFMILRYTTSVNNAGSGWIAVFSGKERNPE